jgi:hypothetical protein
MRLFVPRAGRRLRRFGSTVAAGALLVGGLVFAPGAHANVPTDQRANTRAIMPSVPADSAADWLRQQLAGGLLHNDQFDFDDYGLTIDAGLGLTAVGAYASAVDDIDAALAGNIDDYIAGDAFGDPGSTYAGATAKAAAFAYAVGANPTSYGGVDLVQRLETRTSGTSPIRGRIEDKSSFGDNANTIGQGFAVEALVQASSTEASAATSFLLKQQCAQGYFRLGFAISKAAADQTCDGAAAADRAPDTDVTALVLISLHRSGSNTAAVSGAMAKAVDWLLSTQAGDGSWRGGPTTEAPNTNSTGLAGYALGLAGETAAAAEAAGYIRTHQSYYGTNCPSELAGHDGAIAYNRDGFRAALTDGITAETADQWRRATAQALPALQYAETNAGSPKVKAPARFVRAKRKVMVRVTGLEAGERVCVYNYAKNRGKSIVATSSTRDVKVKTPARTRRFRVGVLSVDGDNSTVLRVLAKTKLSVRVDRPVVGKGRRQTAVATGLRPRERVRVRMNRKVVDRGFATKRGKFTSTFTVRGNRGTATVVVKGQFRNRKGSARFVVR